jgi:hypothetical protein
VERIDSLGGITEYRLRSNGMSILISPNRSVPVVTFLVVYHVGSRNEWPGATGSAHLLEHLLFNKSTKNFGKANGKPTFQEVLYEAGADYGSSNMDEANTLPLQRADQTLLLPAVADGAACGIDPAGEGRIGDDPAAPDRLDEIVLAHDPAAVLDQIDQ